MKNKKVRTRRSRGVTFCFSHAKVSPHNISHNVSFLLDTSGLESKNDWKCDDMGAWKNNKVQRIQLDIEPGGDVIPVDNSHEGYTLKRVYYKNKSSPDLRKIVSFLPGKKHYDSLLWLIEKLHGRAATKYPRAQNIQRKKKRINIMYRYVN